MPRLLPYHRELSELEIEITNMEQGVEVESKALEELKKALNDSAGLKDKQKYILLKKAMQVAEESNSGYMPELAEAIKSVQGALDGTKTWQAATEGRKLRLYHGTSGEAAQRIQRDGFEVSTSGCRAHPMAASLRRPSGRVSVTGAVSSRSGVAESAAIAILAGRSVGDIG